MSLSRALKLSLAFCAAALVLWAFWDFGRRAVGRWREDRSRAVTLTVLHWGNPAEDRIVEGLVREFEWLHPDVRVKRVLTDSSAFQAKLRTMLAAGAPPDLFYLRPEAMAQFAAMNLLLPLDAFVEQQRRDDPGWMEDFYPLILDAYRYDVASQRSGTGLQYGLPKDFTTLVFYVNLDLFRRASIDVARLQREGWTWDQFGEAMARITALRDEAPDLRARNVYGGYLQLSPGTLRSLVWNHGGEFFGVRPDGAPDFRDVRLDEPPAQAALERIIRLRLVDRTVYNPTGIAKDGGNEFLNGNIGCVGPIGRWMVPTYRSIRSFAWDVVPVPALDPANAPAQVVHTAWGVAAGTRHPEQALQLLKFLCGQEGQRQQARAGLAIPALRSVAESDDFLSPPGIPAHNARVFLDPVPRAQIAQEPLRQEWPNLLQDRITESIALGLKDPLTNAREIEAAWHAELDSPLSRRAWPRMRWGLVGWVAAGGAAALCGLLAWRARAERLGPLDRAQEQAGWAFIAPWVIGFVLLTAGPMVVSLLLSFARWSAMEPMGRAEFVGAANYVQMFAADPAFYQSLRVTAYYVLLAVPLGQIAALAVAMLMNSPVRGIAVFRTIYFVPSVVSGVALAMLWLQIFNNDYGILNAVLRPLLEPFGGTPPDWFGRDAPRWAIPAFVLMNLWGVGSGMILYLAGLKGIPASLYEAATVDGAGAARKFWHITLPMLSPLIFYNLIMAIIGSFQVFTQAYTMTGAGPGNSTLFYVLNLFRHAFDYQNMGYASALAWVLFLLCLLLTLLMFRGSRGLVYYEGLKQ
jgi:multiple sugar transport system permease protein